MKWNWPLTEYAETVLLGIGCIAVALLSLG